MVAGAWAGMRTAAQRARLTPPRYRVERRGPGRAGLIVGFADAPAVSRSLLLRGAARLSREGEAGEAVVVDQATEEVVECRTVRPGSGCDG